MAKITIAPVTSSPDNYREEALQEIYFGSRLLEPGRAKEKIALHIIQ